MMSFGRKSSLYKGISLPPKRLNFYLLLIRVPECQNQLQSLPVQGQEPVAPLPAGSPRPTQWYFLLDRNHPLTL